MTSFGTVTFAIVLHAGHNDGPLTDDVIAMIMMGVGLLFIIGGLYRLHTYTPSDARTDGGTASKSEMDDPGESTNRSPESEDAIFSVLPQETTARLRAFMDANDITDGAEGVHEAVSRAQSPDQESSDSEKSL